ncbi:hypothetical protein P5G65_10805 [Paenibacillus chondroitinus]|uniref:Uncharacterized protein n=1 Tax=Paenibacillus chondroitinus TaxID=59842 RepID=A0ABU6DBX3_9BACL|nr:MULTISPECIES: hypothetical protein [Paenibacillus]MCY9656738.1 hypothetical protein [Paenibacillus anseongense]MEB4794387.1 hypothetical protein [Paenibacillus chondroitinus]
MNRICKRFPNFMALTIAVFISLMFLPVSAFADDGNPDDTRSAFERIQLGGNSYAEIKQLKLLSDHTGNIVTFTLHISNESSESLSLTDYWIRLLGKNGDSFIAKLMPQDKEKTKIAAGSSQMFSYYVLVKEATSLHDLKFLFGKWDFSRSPFERQIGEISVPDDFTQVTPAGSSQEIKMSGTIVEAALSDFNLGKNEKNSLPNVTLKLKNLGKYSVTVPDYQFNVRTSEGYTYPLIAKGLTDLLINSQETKEIKLTGSVPANVSTEGWEIVVTQYMPDLKLNVPIADLKLPKESEQEVRSSDEEIAFTDENGLYMTRMNGMYRLPWEDTDILTADFLLMNKGSDSLPIPQLSGYFLLDGKVKVEAKVIIPAKVLGLPKDSSVGMQMVAKVPYTYALSNIELVLQEKTSDGKIIDVLDFESQADLLHVPILNAASSFELTDAGYQSKFSIQNVVSYQAESTEQYTVRVLVENKEKRFTSLAKLVASFRAANGTVYPANVLDVKEKVGPGEKALLIVSSMIPKGVDTSGMNLLLGEAVHDGKLLTQAPANDGDDDDDEDSDDADMYVKPFAFWLPQEKQEVGAPLKGVSLAPYTLTMDHVSTALDNNELSLKFNYEIIKDMSTSVNTEGRKIVFQINDTNGLRAIEWSADLSSFEPRANETPETPQSKLKVGKHKDFKISLANGDLLYKLSFLKTYDVNIYEEYQGHRRLVGTMKNDWFVTSE